MKLERYLKEARRIGQKAAKLLSSKASLSHSVEYKGEYNPVTAMDRLSEKVISEELSKAFPDHGILAEEGTRVQSKGGYCWVIDPLDGTTNYAHGLAVFGVSMALVLDGKPLVGVIQFPKLKEEFYASCGGGAYLNGELIRVSAESVLGRSFLATGEPYDIREKLDYHAGLFKKFLAKAFAIRRLGAACYDMANLACGRYDGYWESGLKPWDVAAGILLVEEAGGKVTDYAGRPYLLGKSKTLLATNGLIHQAMREVFPG